MNPQVIYSLFEIGKLDFSQLPKYAADLLMQGNDSMNLAVLAGMKGSEDEEEFIPYLNNFFHEYLSKEDITSSKRYLPLAKFYAGKILNRELSPYEGARKIWTDVWNEYDHPNELATFVNDATDYEEKFPKDPKILENIIKNAKILLEAGND